MGHGCVTSSLCRVSSESAHVGVPADPSGMRSHLVYDWSCKQLYTHTRKHTGVPLRAMCAPLRNRVITWCDEWHGNPCCSHVPPFLVPRPIQTPLALPPSTTQCQTHHIHSPHHIIQVPRPCGMQGNSAGSVPGGGGVQCLT